MSNKRVSFFLEKKFQIWFSLYSILILTIGSAISITAMYALKIKMQKFGTYLASDTKKSYLDFVNLQFNQLFSYLFISIIVSLMLVCIISFIYSIRVVGPLKRLSQLLEDENIEALANFKYRHNDHLSFLNKSIVTCFQKIRKKYEVI